jgi:hypothetical protein
MQGNNLHFLLVCHLCALFISMPRTIFISGKITNHMDTGIVPLPVDKPEHGEVIRTVIAGTVEDYQALIEAKQQRKAAAEARALEAHRNDSIDSLMLTLPTHRTLARAGITIVGQLVAMTEAELRSLGPVNMKNIVSRLGNLGLRLCYRQRKPR